MKTGAMIRIIIWAVIALLLVGVLLYFLMGGSWPFGARTVGFGSSAHTEEPAAAERPQLEQVNFSNVSKLEIHWISGGVTVESASGEGGFSEDYSGQEKYRMDWYISGDTLVIEDFSKDLSGLLNINLPSKNLIVSLPRAMEEITVVTTSAEVTFTGGIETQKLDVSTVSGRVSGVLARADEAKTETVSGSVDLVLGWCRDVDISTTSGGVGVACYQGLKEAELDSVSGSLDITIPKGSAYTLDWDTVSGGVYDDTGAGGGFGSTGTVEIDAETVSGGLTIHSAAEQEMP